MCGITGVVNFDEKINIPLFIGMNNIIKHRGPDDEGYTLIGKDNICKAYGKDTVTEIKNKYNNIDEVNGEFSIALGHRRLSILDLSSKGHQPMADEEDNIHITYNGEIYNYIEIREELKDKGYNFYTNCDTEVIINAYKEWGEECVKKFNGMWGFAIFDRQKSKIFCSRDRFGIKPFYYYQKNNKVIFSSEVKQIIEDSTVKRIANDEIIYSYLYYGKNDYNEKTFFKDIYALEPSFNMVIYLDFANKALKVKKYKYYEIEKKEMIREENKAISKFKDEFNRSIEYRLRSDIPVGSCLSGGLDSSSIVTVACNKLKKDKKNVDFQTFTSSYDDNPKIDERYYSNIIVKESDCKENLIFPNKKDLVQDIKKVIWHHDFPFPTLSIFAGWSVMKEVNKKNVKVLLDGQGSDEILLGYERYAIFLLRDNLKHLEFKKLLNNYKMIKNRLKIGFKRIIGYFLFFSNISFLQYWVKWKSNDNKIFNKTFLKKYKWNKDYLSKINFKDEFELCKTEIFHSNLSQLLRYEDRNSMAFSIETRVPFLDYKLVEHEMQIPVDLKVKDGWTKYLLRKAMEHDMNTEVVYRKKELGFAAPQKDWLDQLSKEFVEKYLNSMKTHKYFNEEEVRKLFEEKRNHDMRWKFLSLEIWIEQFNVIIEE